VRAPILDLLERFDGSDSLGGFSSFAGFFSIQPAC
jgi:hypothetical protein